MTVYVPQMPSKFDSASDLWVPTINIEPARKHGNIVVMLPPQANRLDTEPLVQVMKERMATYGRDDFIVAVGDPTLFGAACAIAQRKTGGFLRMLKWDRISSVYLVVEIQL